MNGYNRISQPGCKAEIQKKNIVQRSIRMNEMPIDKIINSFLLIKGIFFCMWSFIAVFKIIEQSYKMLIKEEMLCCLCVIDLMDLFCSNDAMFFVCHTYLKMSKRLFLKISPFHRM